MDRESLGELAAQDAYRSEDAPPDRAVFGVYPAPRTAVRYPAGSDASGKSERVMGGLADIGGDLAKRYWENIKTPGALLMGESKYRVEPEVPGYWSDRDEARTAQTAGAITRGAMLTGLDATTGSIPRAFMGEANTLGAGGGRLPTQSGVDILQNKAIEASQPYTKSQLPPPVPFIDRIWNNYAKRMTPDEFLTSEPLWSGAQRMAEHTGMAEQEAFAKIANNMFERMGVERRLTPELANEIIGEQRGSAMLSDIFKQDRAVDQLPNRLNVLERGRSGRPIRTEPLPIGTEDEILRRGYELATGQQPRPIEQPPLMQAASRVVPSRQEGMGGAAVGEASPTLFDYSRVRDVPDVPQFDLPRYDPARGVSERVQDLVKNKPVQRKMMEAMERGKDIGGDTFYYNEPLRGAFVSELGGKKGPDAFARYMDYVAASSPRSTVEANARNASFYYVLDRQGRPLPEVNPQPYGHMAQELHRGNVEKIRSGEYFDPVKNPKPISFSQNLQGNFQPVTVDAHAFKLPAMLMRNPDFLATSIKSEKGVPSIYPSRMYESGELPMREAVQRPVYWTSKPNANEYAAMEQYYKNLAGEVGLSPAQGQGSAWAEGGKVTGLGSVAGDPFMRSVENRAIRTAAERGITPQEALSRMIRGKAPLLGVAGAAGMGALADQENYQQ